VPDDVVGEARALGAVDVAVIESPGQVHHLAHHDGAGVVDHGALAHAVHAHDGYLGVVDDGRGEEPALRPQRGDGEGAAADVGLGQAAAAGGVGEPHDLPADLRHGEAVGVAHHRHHQPLVGGHGDADVVLAAQDQLV